MPIPMSMSFTGLLLLPTHSNTKIIDSAAPRAAKIGVLYAPNRGRPPMMMAKTAPVLAPDETPST